MVVSTPGVVLTPWSWKRVLRGKMGTGIDLFLDWENGIWVAGTGIWQLRMGNEVLKNGNGIEVMRVDSQFFHVLCILKYNFDLYLVSLVMIFVVNYIFHSTTCEQA
jgi:hypothetical protein